MVNMMNPDFAISQKILNTRGRQSFYEATDRICVEWVADSTVLQNMLYMQRAKAHSNVRRQTNLMSYDNY
mgnify:CR=1 FL=1